MAPNSRVGLAKVRELICALYEILVELLPEKKPARKKLWTRSEAGAKRRQRSGNCKKCGGLIRWMEFIPCPRGAG